MVQRNKTGDSRFRKARDKWRRGSGTWILTCTNPTTYIWIRPSLGRTRDEDSLSRIKMWGQQHDAKYHLDTIANSFVLAHNATRGVRSSYNQESKLIFYFYSVNRPWRETPSPNRIGDDCSLATWRPLHFLLVNALSIFSLLLEG